MMNRRGEGARINGGVLQVYDPAMCCSTGVCGPEVDGDLVRFAADLDWLKNQGVAVEFTMLLVEKSWRTGSSSCHG